MSINVLQRIVCDPTVLSGKPVIKGTRLSVSHILNVLGHGSTRQEILAEYDGLVDEDITACLLFASESLEDTEFMPLTTELA